MNVVLTILLAVQILSALVMIGLILMQHGKGADAGAAFGGGGAGSASLFGASGGANFLSRSTGVLAAVFLATTLGLAYFGNLREAPSSGSVLEGIPAPAQQIPGIGDAPPPAAGGDASAPAVPAAPAAPAEGAAQIPGK
ncbi:MAG: preprotein translocase subunit SecG [Hydrogenophaga sp.]|nr:preprotein translocase subunit SecG [Hydrogenophaga sp.]